MYLQKKFSVLDSQAILVFRTKRHCDIPTGTSLTGTSNAGGVGYLESQRISGFAINNCCTVVCRSHLATGFLFTASMRVLNHQALRPITIHRHPWVYSARPTKCGLALYTVTVDVNRVYDSKARRYAEDKQNRIELHY